MNEPKTQTKQFSDIPPEVYETFALWLEGHDVKELTTDSIWYRHKNILTKHGIDISKPNQNSGRHNPITNQARSIPPGMEYYMDAKFQMKMRKAP